MSLEEKYYEEKNITNYTSENLKRTKATIDYLKDNKVSKDSIIEVFKSAPNNVELTLDSLPEWLWSNSLLEKGKFYYHSELRIIPKAPCMMKDGKLKTQKFSREMKIMYTPQKILNYYYSTCNVRPEFRNEKKDLGALNHLLEKYKRFNFISPVDFVLFLIDYGRQNGMAGKGLLKIDDVYAEEVFNKLKDKVEIARRTRQDEVIPRE